MDWRPVDDGMDRPEQGRPGLVVEDDDDAGRRQQRRVRLALASGSKGLDNVRVSFKNVLASYALMDPVLPQAAMLTILFIRQISCVARMCKISKILTRSEGKRKKYSNWWDSNPRPP